MDNYREKRLERNLKSQQTTSVVIGVLLLLSLIGNILLFVRNSSISGEREQLVNEKNLIENNKQEIEETNAQLQAEVRSLNEKIERLNETTAELEVDIQRREARLAQLSRQTFEVDDLRQQIVSLESVKEEHEKLQKEKQGIVAELDSLRERLQQEEGQHQLLVSQVEEASYLRAYNICVHNFRDRWICRPVYMDVARRVDRTTVSFEIGENAFVDSGGKDIHLVITGPGGDVISPSSETFTINETGESANFSEHATIQYEDRSVPMDFSIEHDVNLESGTYFLQVYIDGVVSGEKEFVLD